MFEAFLLTLHREGLGRYYLRRIGYWVETLEKPLPAGC